MPATSGADVNYTQACYLIPLGYEVFGDRASAFICRAQELEAVTLGIVGLGRNISTQDLTLILCGTASPPVHYLNHLLANNGAVVTKIQRADDHQPAHDLRHVLPLQEVGIIWRAAVSGQ